MSTRGEIILVNFPTLSVFPDAAAAAAAAAAVTVSVDKKLHKKYRVSKFGSCSARRSEMFPTRASAKPNGTFQPDAAAASGRCFQAGEFTCLNQSHRAAAALIEKRKR